MSATFSRAALVAVTLALSACSDGFFWEDEDTLDQPVTSAAADPNALPPSGVVQPPVSVAPAPGGVPVQASNTYVGQKVAQLQADAQRLYGQYQAHNAQLDQLQGELGAISQRYFATTGAINSALQAGSTPGNPILSQQWTQAQSDLERINDTVARLNQLSNQVAGDSSLVGYLIEGIRSSYSLSGAVDADHRALRQLSDDVNRTAVVVERLQDQVADALARQNAYVGNERRNLSVLSSAIKTGELYGTSLANPSYQATSFTSAPSITSIAGNRSPLVVIRFDRANVSFQQPLYAAVSQAMQRKPDVNFDLLTVTPAKSQGGLGAATAQRNAEAVLRALADMGLPANRVRLSSTTSGATDANEVQLYVR